MNNNQLTRRRFLTIGGTTALWLTTGCRGSGGAQAPTSVMGTPSSLPLIPTTQVPATPAAAAAIGNDHVLVVVQLLGGNDALNTVIPDVGSYRDARPRIAVPEGELLTFAGLGGYGLNSALGPLRQFWDTGRLGIALGTGFEAQTRSHFQSRDVWWQGHTANAAAALSADGWLARWLEASALTRLGEGATMLESQEQSMSAQQEPLEAIALGIGPRALAGSGTASVADPSNFGLATPSGISEADFERFLLSVAAASPQDSAVLQAVRGSLPEALSTKKILDALNDDSANDPYSGQSGVELGIQLQTAATLISARPGLRVVTVGIDGFDTHADQLASQSALLGQAASAIDGFWAALPEKDRDRTLMLTTSEFGRRVQENGSLGTDHGRAGLQFLVGSGLRKSQVVGSYDLGNLEDGDLPITVPGIELYGDALRWLGGPVGEVLGEDPQATGLLAV